MPTGTGKTTMFSAIAKHCYENNMYAMAAVHRGELVEQIHERLGEFEIPAGIIQSGVKPEKYKSVQVASIQTLANRKPPPADVIIIDECHHAKAETYRRLWDNYPNAKILGVTATPVRTNGEGFDDLFDEMVNIHDVRWFIQRKYLVKPKHFVCSRPDLSNVLVNKDGEFIEEPLSRIMMTSKHTTDAVRSYQKLIPGKRCIGFAVNIAHSKSIVVAYNNAGIPAAHIDGEMDKDERARLIGLFRDGEVLYLSNVDIVSEGFDLPACEAVQLLRPTQSLSLYIQQVGRCLRTASGKEFGYVLDNASCWLIHGIAGINYEWNLEGKDPKPKKESLEGMEAPLAMKKEDGSLGMSIEGDEVVELLEISEELEHLAMFEKYVAKGEKKGYKPLWAVYEYQKYVINQGLALNQFEVDYCKKRMGDLGVAPAEGFWYHLVNPKEDKLKESA